MVMTRVAGVREVYMVNEADPDRARAEVLRHTTGTLADVLSPVSDETLAHHLVKPNEPWLCFTIGANWETNVGEGWGIVSTAFSHSDITDVGRGELHLT